MGSLGTSRRPRATFEREKRSTPEACAPSLKTKRRQFSNRAGGEHENSHLVFQPVNTVGLDDHVRGGRTARRQKQIMEVHPDTVHARFELKCVCAPGPQHYVAVNHDSRRAGIKKK